MKRLVWDVESNGLLDEVTDIWCISIKNIDTGKLITLQGNDLQRDIILNNFSWATSIIGHNIISYDIPLLKSFYNIDLIDILGKEAIIDTLLISQCLNPDRELPRGCPTSIKNPITNRSQLITNHSLAAWGYRVGNKKVEIHDWRTFTPEMIERCEGDVIINEKVYYALMREAGIEF